MIDASIIVIAHEAKDDVIACLRSIEEHGGDVTTETFLIDNGSGDGTVEAVREAFPDVEVIALPTNEGATARNHGLRAARGRHRMFLDSDAQLTAGALADLVAFLDGHPEIGMVGPQLVYPDGGPQPSARRLPPLVLPLLRRPPLSRWFENGRIVRRHLMLDEHIEGTREAEYLIGACQLFSARAQEAVGELDPAIPFPVEDIDWCIRFRMAGFRIAFRPEAVVIHGYRRTTARRPLSRTALQHLYGFAAVHWKWRRQRRRLLRDGAAMEARGWAL